MKKKKQQIIDETHRQLKKDDFLDGLHIQEWRRKNEELEKILVEKTLELERLQREAKIEVALERVRARVMAMRHSDELSEAAELLYNEFLKLEITNGSLSKIDITSPNPIAEVLATNLDKPTGMIFNGSTLYFAQLGAGKISKF